MTDLEIFESLRPHVEPLSPRDRAGMRLDLFGSETPSGSAHAASGGADAAVHYDLDRGLRTETPPRPGSRRLLSTAAVLLLAVGIAGVWITVGNREAGDPAPAQQPQSTTTESAPASQPLEAPVWYDTIRPLLPDGFDQIALTTAQPEVVAFKAFRTGTRQLLDITITLRSGYDMKATGEAVTFSDEHGDFIESTSSVALTTPDQRRVIVRCGLSPVGGGAVGSVSLADSARDYCGDGFDNLDLDPASRRALAATLADEFPTDAVTPAFGHPDTNPEPVAVTPIVDDFVGDTRPFGMEQADGVLRVANLSPTVGEPSSTELTVIHGMWPPDGDGSAFDDTYANSPQGRFFHYDDIAVALVVVDGTGYHIATTDVRQDHLAQLGELLERLIDQTANTAPNEPVDTAATTPAPTTSVDPTGHGVIIDMTDSVDDATGVRVWDNIRVAPDAIGWFDATTGVPPELVGQRRLAADWTPEAMSSLFTCTEWTLDETGPVCNRLSGGNGIEHVDYGDSLGIGAQLGGTDVRSQLWNQAYGQLWGYDTIAEVPEPTEIPIGDTTGLSYRVDDHAYLAWEYAPDIVVWLHARGLNDDQLATIAEGVEPVQLPDRLPIALELRPPGYTPITPMPGDRVEDVPLLVSSDLAPRLKYGTVEGRPCATFEASGGCRSVEAPALIPSIEWNDQIPDRLVAIAPSASGLILRTTSVDGTVTDNSLTPTGLGFDLATWTPPTIDEHLLSASLIEQSGAAVADTGELGEIER